MHQILAPVLAAALSAIGFVVRRWIRKDRISEVIERRLKLVALYQKMIAAGLDDGDLDRLERHLAEGAPRRCNGASDPSNTGPSGGLGDWGLIRRRRDILVAGHRRLMLKRS